MDNGLKWMGSDCRGEAAKGREGNKPTPGTQGWGSAHLAWESVDITHPRLSWAEKWDWVGTKL